MIALKRYFTALTIMLAVCLAATQAQAAVGISDKAALQAAMQQHIDRNLVEGAYLYLDTASGTVRPLYPQKAHPMILKMGDYYVLCSDFRDENNVDVNIDFYLARGDDDYVVFHALVDDRALLREWIRAGKAVRLQ